MTDLRDVRECLRKSDDCETRCQEKIQQHMKAAKDKRMEIESHVSAAEAELHNERQATQSIQSEVSALENVGNEATIEELWLQIEEAQNALANTRSEINSLMEEKTKLTNSAEQTLEDSSGLYHVYAAATGVHFDTATDGLEGYVAIGDRVENFDVRNMGDKAQAADVIWEAIEKCLPHLVESRPLPRDTPAAIAGA